MKFKVGDKAKIKGYSLLTTNDGRGDKRSAYSHSLNLWGGKIVEIIEIESVHPKDGRWSYKVKFEERHTMNFFGIEMEHIASSDAYDIF